MRKGAAWISILLMLFILFDACRKETQEIPLVQEPTAEDADPFYLYWDAHSPQELREDFETGFLWGLSYLGAELPASTAHQIMEWEGNRMTFHFEKAGFQPAAERALKSYINYLQTRQEYRHRGGIDAGRFIMLTLNSSWHYYQLVGMPDQQYFFELPYLFRKEEAGVIESAVSSKARLIRMTRVPPAKDYKMAFIAKEIADTSDPETVHEFEVMDVMSNGQLRFGIYDNQGDLQPVSSAAGKPTKCLWCHEINVQQPFSATTQYRNYLSPDSFRTEVDSFQIQLERYRNTLNSAIDFSRKQDHTQLELIYISFNEPSAYRLSKEWGMTEQEVKERLVGLTPHQHHEFPQLGDVYWRKDVDPLAPYAATPVPESPREASSYEPNWPIK